MDTWSALVVGFGLGLRHASDADHVAVVSSLIQRSPSLLTAARIATLWGLGHTLTFLCLGLSLICLDLRVPPRFEQLTEILVALMLLVFGAWHLLSHAEAARAPSQGGGLGRTASPRRPRRFTGDRWPGLLGGADRPAVHLCGRASKDSA